MLYYPLLFIEERWFLMEKFRKTTEDDLVELMALFEEGIAFLKAQGSPQWQKGYGNYSCQRPKKSFPVGIDGFANAGNGRISGNAFNARNPQLS